MNTEKAMNELSKEYPGKKIIKNDEENATEIICEIDPVVNHPERGIAIAIIDRSKAHYHRKITEVYEVIRGELTIFINSQEHKLKKGDSLMIKPEDIHYAVGDETWVKVCSEPGWSPEDHILAD